MTLRRHLLRRLPPAITITTPTLALGIIALVLVLMITGVLVMIADHPLQAPAILGLVVVAATDYYLWLSAIARLFATAI